MTDLVSPWQPLTTARRSPALEILLHGPLSRGELARRLDMSAASLTRLTKPLIDSGLIVEMPKRNEPRTGRPSHPLDVVPTVNHFIGVRLTADHAYALVTDLRSEIVTAADRALPGRTPDAVTAVISDLVASLTRQASEITGLGVCIGGLVEGQRDVVRAPFLGWKDRVALAEMIEESTALPTVIDNDLLALTKAEHWFGAGRGHPHFALITTGVGIGYGLVVHDQLVDTPRAGVGFLEHYPLDPYGPLCVAGHHGCAAAMLATTAIENRVSISLGRHVNYTDVLDLAATGQPVAAAVVTDSAHALGRLIAAAANFTMAPRIIVTGEGAQLANVAADALHQSLNQERDPVAAPVDLTIEELHIERWARGAAVSAIQAHISSSHLPDAWN